MKYILSTLAACLIMSICFSQQVNLTWAPEKKSKYSSTEFGYVGRSNGHFYTLRAEDKVLFLSKTRVRDMSQVWERVISWSDLNRKNTSNKNLTFHSFKLFKDHFIFLFEDLNTKDDIQKMYAQKISMEGKPIGELLEVGSRIKMRRSKDGNFQVSYSPDSTSFLLTTNPYYEKYANEKFQFKVVDHELNVLHSLEITLPFRDQDFTIQSISLSKNKEIFMLARIDIPKRDRKDDEAEYYYQILKVSPAEKGKVKEFEMKLPQKYIDEVDVILDKNDRVKCFGFYADMQNNGKRKDGINGIFYFALSANSIENVNMKEFDAKLVEDIAGKRRANRDKGLRSTFKLKYFFDKPDGGVVVLAEEQFVNVVTTYSSTGGSRTTYHYYNNSVLAVNIDDKGKILWYAHVPKLQHAVNDRRFNSFHSLYAKGKVFIIYNDERSNATLNTYDRTMSNYMKAVPVVVTINEAGKSDKRMLASGKPGKYEFTVKPNISDKISDTEAFFYGDRLSKGPCVIGGRRIKAQRFGILAVN